jgi:hypothetical protein
MDTHETNTHNMATALSAAGVPARVAGMGGGTIAVVTPYGVLVAAPGYWDAEDGPYVVGLDCQSHPLHGTNAGTRYVDSGSDWQVIVDGVIAAIRDLRTVANGHACGDCPDVDPRAYLSVMAGAR